MTRHLFALLALLTGLAALGSPAQASLAEVLACDSSITAAAGFEDVGSETAPDRPAPKTPRESRKGELPERRAPLPAALRPPVLMGVERAYE